MDGCPGWLVTHDDGVLECLDVDCLSSDAPAHDWRMSCADLAEPCGRCTEPAALPDRQWRAA